MEKNTINLSVKDYNEMRDFNEAIKKNHAVKYGSTWGMGNELIIYTKDEAIAKMAEITIELNDKIRELKNPKSDKLSLSEIKQMSLWEFRKWKRQS